MIRIRTIPLLALGVLLSAPTLAAPPSQPAAPPAAAGAPPHSGVARPAAGTPRAAVTPATRNAAGPRTLADVHIEGEIPVPQVLFVTARDQRRFVDFQHHRYLRTSREIARDTALPRWVAVTGNAPVPAAEADRP